MCGIFGVYGGEGVSEQTFRDMGASIRHRGPDGIGFHYSSQCAIGNTRLAILDPEHGDQPFYSEDKKVVVVQNGEIFNFQELRAELETAGYVFSTNCDTEILPAMYQEYGEEFVSRLNGMFAIAVYDIEEQLLILYRDRVGEKPLYYTDSTKGLIFGSEIKVLSEVVTLEPDWNAVNAMLRLNYVPSPLTAFKGVRHVKPGTYIKFHQDGVSEHEWWDLSTQQPRQFSSEKAWTDELLPLLDSAVSLRLVSDVPFGAFLSGGVDSSTVVGLMTRHLPEKVKTFTIGFPDPRFDESLYAQQASDRFGTDHVCEIVNYDIVSDWDSFIRYCDQPHGDVSFMPMRKVAELASRDVKMVLTGDGADELFAGYDKYVPLLGEAESGGDFLKKYLPYIELFDKSQLRDLWRPEIAEEIDEFAVDEMLSDSLNRVEHFDDVNKALYIDMCFLLSGNNLVKPDRMAMSHSLETRAPFLDYRIMEFAFQTPGRLKLKNSDKKHYLKKAVTPLIGQELAYRKKQMFTMPIGEWFKNELKQYCEEILLSPDSRISQVFRPDAVESILTQHLSGESNRTREVRALISIELWLRQVA